ncbi:diguanylate cyclase [Methylobacterium sp. J-068]|uniref:sensor domain-containing diguanylate cyclase n=1 Tax=Methylobacterium sp. J-068 TaxID=2836649 RepID=UPI001FBB5638|nr:diguanylate cyclase [Methylobacterium sp. J-068]MCJ2032757.1 diguanylate cyclase [Methylobacterium sp. J-068]
MELRVLEMSAQSAGGRLFRWTHSAAWLSAFSLLSVVGLCAVSAFMLWQLRNHAAWQSEITSRSLIQVLGRDIARNIELYDLSLRAVVDGMKRPQVMEASPELRHMILFDRAATAAGFAYALVLDRNGNVIANSQTLGPMSINAADREYFRHFADGVDDGLHISAPIVSRVSGQWVLTLSRRLSNPDGSFAGVVTGGIQLDYFRNLFAMTGADRAGTVTLYGPGGTIAMREPFVQSQIGTRVAESVSYLEMLKRRSGSFVGPAMIGEGDRQFVFTDIGDYPLQLSTAVPLTKIYANWQGEALGLGSVVLSLCAVTMLLTWLFGRELTQRRRAEEVTAALNLELERLATTDALTGLCNRRRFDEVLAREWRRAVRTQQPLSLVLLDADYFKGFNDRYGHQRGDEALRLIARSIEATTDPTRDITCRIGGEEFAVILPDTDAEGAKLVAERMREAIAGWKVPHVANPHGILSVSAGLAQIPQTPAADPAALIAAADRALYGAKSQGRNRVQIAGQSEAGLRIVAQSRIG